MDITKQTVAFIREHFSNNSDGHDAEHSLRVYRNALAIASEEDCDKDVVALAALLHDVDDKTSMRVLSSLPSVCLKRRSPGSWQLLTASPSAAIRTMFLLP